MPETLSRISSVEAAAAARQRKGFIQMTNMLSRAAALSSALATLLCAIAAPAFSQAPTDAQRSAIRSSCRADYQAHCASVPPGGMASLQCLQQNMSSLSPSCQSAVRAVEPAAEPKAESKPEPAPSAAPPKAETAPSAEPARPATETAATPAPKATASKTAKKPSSAQIAAIRSACRADYQKVCVGVPTGGAAALQCLEKNKSRVSASCDKAVSAATGGTAAPAAGGAPAAAAADGPAAAPAPVAAIVLRPMLPREEFFVLRSACGGDARALCGGVPAGGGRIMQCLASQAGSLSPACADALGQFAAR
jgi:outer membrane biosynthesis protein TonB